VGGNSILRVSSGGGYTLQARGWRPRPTVSSSRGIQYAACGQSRQYPTHDRKAFGRLHTNEFPFANKPIRPEVRTGYRPAGTPAGAMPALWAARPLDRPCPHPHLVLVWRRSRTGHGLPAWSRQTREPAPAPRHRPPQNPGVHPPWVCRGADRELANCSGADSGAHVGPGVGGRSYSSVSNICSGQGPSYHFGYVIFAKSGAVLPTSDAKIAAAVLAQSIRKGPHPGGATGRTGAGTCSRRS